MSCEVTGAMATALCESGGRVVMAHPRVLDALARRDLAHPRMRGARTAVLTDAGVARRARLLAGGAS